MAKKWTIKEGDHIIVRGRHEEDAIVYEGDVTELAEIPGTDGKQFLCGGRFIVERWREGDDQD